jgi:GT2 family glycosyltransferase
MKYPLVYVLILNWNGRKITIDCVASVLKSDYPNFKVVVIDNGSEDTSVSALRKTFGGRIEILENRRNLGYALGFNVGLKHGFVQHSAEYCLIMNNDTVIDSRSISELVKVFKTSGDIGFVTGKVYYYDSPTIIQTVGKKEDPIRWNGGHIGNGEEDNGQYDEKCERYFADDIYMLVSRKLYRDTGGYDPTFFLQGEDYDWQARAKKMGYRIMYTPYAKLWHKESMTIGKTSALKAYYDARNPMLVILLHKPVRFFKRYFWLHFRRDILRDSLVALKQMHVTKALAKWQGLFSAIIWGVENKKISIRHFL